MTINNKAYADMLEQPWGQLQYQITFAQLNHLKRQTILDFGSGFGLTSRFLAQDNQVIAIEPCPELLQITKAEAFDKRLGSYDQLLQLPDQSFDTIICHNVLEYIPQNEYKQYLEAFERLLKPLGKLSLIKHNQVGKVMQSVVFSNNTKTGLEFLEGKDFHSQSFSHGQTYDLDDLIAESTFTIENYLGIRTFYGLQPNSFKMEEGWLDKLLEMELAVSDLKPYKDISFLQHYWLSKNA